MQWPSTTVYNLSNISKIKAEGWCMVQTMVWPRAANFLSKLMHWLHDELSSPLQGRERREVMKNEKIKKMKCSAKSNLQLIEFRIFDFLFFYKNKNSIEILKILNEAIL